jgi:cephalosporin hydroxylase
MNAADIPLPLFRALEAGTLAHRYRGVACFKNPIDLAILARLLWEAKPRTIIEVGSAHGGSALWMRDQMRVYEIPCRVHSVDVDPPQCGFPIDLLHFYRGSGRNLGATFSDELMIETARPLLIVEDADHFPETTAAVLAFFDKWSQPGEYVIVEDGDAEKFYPGCYRGGPAAAIKAFLAERGGDFQVDRRYCDAFGITFNPDGYIRRVK